MSTRTFRYTRRAFMTAAAATGASWPFAQARAAAKYRRYSVTSAEGQKMLASYAKGVEAMLKLPAEHPQNWFRNAFIHLMDCPHGNWWFYVWHRGYLGYFERSIRNLSGDPDFALPYWDWTELPQIPDAMFDGVLTPTDKGFAQFTGNLALFTNFIQQPVAAYWNALGPAQKAQQKLRGYNAFSDLWNDVTGYSPATQAGISGNEAFAVTCSARYLSRDNPKLDKGTAYDCSPFVVLAGLLPTDFNNATASISFTSTKVPNHNAMPVSRAQFSTLEGMPHNTVHNCIGGAGPLDPGPYGNMTNNLSPIDPIFFLHHSNMDRLWDVWTRKQQRLGLPYLPSGADLKTFSDEPFLFYVDGHGKYVGPAKAGDYLSTEVFDYDYAPGFGEVVVQPPTAVAARAAPVKGAPTATGMAVALPAPLVKGHLADSGARPLVASITMPRPTGSGRMFDILVNAAADGTRPSADSPGFAGVVSFFGPTMPGMKHDSEVTFAVPLPKAPALFAAAPAANAPSTVNIRVVPSGGQGGPAPAVKAVTVHAL